MRYGHFIMPIFSAWVLVLGLTGIGFADDDTVTLGKFKVVDGDFFGGAVVKAHTNLGCSLHLVSDVPDTVDPRK